jgi:hypothetical protein
MSVRLDSRLGHRGYTIFHVERCVQVRNVVWVDDQINCWAEYVQPLRFDGGLARVKVFEARRILILADRRLVLINPVGLESDLDRQRGDVLVERRTAAHWSA